MEHNLNKESITLLIGINIRKLRQKKGLSLGQLAKAAGLSISYLSEIEKGKKHPSVEKLIDLSNVLNTTYQALSSVDQDLEGFNHFHDNVLKSFPFQQFDISANDLLPILNNSDTNLSAFIRTLYDVVQTYDTNVDTFLLTALSSLQIMKLNYFDDIETEVLSFRKKYSSLLKQPTVDSLSTLLTQQLGVSVTYTEFKHIEDDFKIRAIYKKQKQPSLYINSQLSSQQIRFLLAKECGYQILKITKRSDITPDIQMDSFDEVLNNFRAAYFASALLMDREKMIVDLSHFFSKKNWNEDSFWKLITKYDVTPETLFHRMSQLLPKEFGITHLYSLRIHHDFNEQKFIMTKELNFTDHFSPKSVKTEHYCRRWTPIRLLQSLAANPDARYQLTAERVEKVGTPGSFFNISYAHSSSVRNKTNVSFTLGFYINDAIKKSFALVTSPNIETKYVNETCERCPLSQAECSDRVAPPRVYEAVQKKEALKNRLKSLIKELN